MQELWFAPDALEWREQIIVPFCWESLAAWGEGDAAGNDNYYSTRIFTNPLEVRRANHRSAPRYEVGWYRRAIEIPANEAWKKKRIILTIGAADFFTDCWCNGKHLGHHEGGYTPFEFDLTEALKSEGGKVRGTIVLRVEDPMDNSEQPVGKQWKWYTTTSGIWQTVWLEPRAPNFIDRFRFSPDIDTGTAQVRVFRNRNESAAVVELEVTAPDGTIIRETAEFSGACAEKTIHINPLFLWNPNNPYLYWVNVRLIEGDRVVDSVRTYFGMRRISHAPTDDANAPEVLCLNGVAR